MTLGDRIAVLRDGRLQQFGTPLEIYRRPANRFVAGFVGTPPMNLIPGRIERRRFTGSFVSMELPVSVAPRGPGNEPSGAFLGIRPQHVSVTRGEPESKGVEVLHRCRVQHIEPLGDSVTVYSATPDGTTWIARGPADFVPGPEVDLYLHLAGAHIFADNDDGRRLSVE